MDKIIKVSLRKIKSIAFNKHRVHCLHYQFSPCVELGDGKKVYSRKSNLFLYVRPEGYEQREHNKVVDQLAKKEMLELFKQVNFSSPSFFHAPSLVDYVMEKTKNDLYHARYIRMIKLFTEYTNQPLLKINDLKVDDINGFVQYLLQNKHLQANTIQAQYMVYLTKILRLAIRENLSSINLKDIRRVKITDTVPSYLTLEELKLLEQTPYPSCEEFRRMCLFASLTGMRISDIRNLKWNSMDMQNDSVLVHFNHRKMGNLQGFYISLQAYEFCHPSEPRTRENVFSPFKPFMIKYHLDRWITMSGIQKHITFHTFRHTYAMLQLAAGTKIYHISKLLGHRRISTTERYAKILPEALKESVNKIVL